MNWKIIYAVTAILWITASFFTGDMKIQIFFSVLGIICFIMAAAEVVVERINKP